MGFDVSSILQVVANPTVEQRRTEYKALEFLTHQQLFFVAYAQVGLRVIELSIYKVNRKQFILFIFYLLQSLCSHTTLKHRDMERSTTFRLGDEEMLVHA
jgi:hypothetical protein